MERATRVPELVFPAGGMNMLEGPTAENNQAYKAYSLSATRTGELSRMVGKVATGNLGVPIMGFVDFWSPNGFIVNLTQTGIGTGIVGTVIAETVTIPTSSTSTVHYYGYSDEDGWHPGETYDEDLTGSVTQLTNGAWYADYTANAKNEECEDEELSGSLLLVGTPPFSFVLNTCVIISACGLPGRGVKITSGNGIDTCYLTGAGFIDFSPSYRQVLPTWHIVISSSTRVLVDTIVSSATEPVLNL